MKQHLNTKFLERPGTRQNVRFEIMKILINNCLVLRRNWLKIESKGGRYRVAGDSNF